jgi:hypothetical protein
MQPRKNQYTLIVKLEMLRSYTQPRQVNLAEIK